MKKMIMLALGVAFAGSMAMAQDNVNAEKATDNTSKNPLTGTVKNKKTYTKKMKNKDGQDSKVDVTETTKTTTDGKVSKKVDATASEKH